MLNFILPQRRTLQGDRNHSKRLCATILILLEASVLADSEQTSCVPSKDHYCQLQDSVVIATSALEAHKKKTSQPQLVPRRCFPNVQRQGTAYSMSSADPGVESWDLGLSRLSQCQGFLRAWPPTAHVGKLWSIYCPQTHVTVLNGLRALNPGSAAKRT